MQVLTTQQTSDYLEAATIVETVEFPGVIIHRGIAETGHPFVLMNDCFGYSALTESM